MQYLIKLLKLLPSTDCKNKLQKDSQEALPNLNDAHEKVFVF